MTYKVVFLDQAINITATDMRSNANAMGKNNRIKAYFAKNSSLVDDNFFGTSMSVAPLFKPTLDDEIKLRITKHAKKQQVIGKSIKSVTISGTQILN